MLKSPVARKTRFGVYEVGATIRAGGCPDHGMKPVATLGSATGPTPMRLVIDTTKPGSASDTFILPCNGAGYNARIDWGDGSAVQTITGTPGNVTHVYASGGVKTVQITENVIGGFPTIYFNNAGDRLKLMEVATWGDNKWASLNNAFNACTNLVITAADVPKTSTVTSFQSAFSDCRAIASLPLLDMGAAIDVTFAWKGCVALTSFPPINMPNATSFQQAWRSCVLLSSFPVIDLHSAQNLAYAWFGCYGLTSFPLVAVGSASIFSNTWNGCTGLNGAAFPLLDFHSATNMADMLTDVGISKPSYNAMLNQLRNGSGGAIPANANTSVIFGAGNAHYDAGPPDGTAARAYLVGTKSWAITDGGTP